MCQTYLVYQPDTNPGLRCFPFVYFRRCSRWTIYDGRLHSFDGVWRNHLLSHANTCQKDKWVRIYCICQFLLKEWTVQDTRTPIVTVLTRDGIVYYAVMFCTFRFHGMSLIHGVRWFWIEPVMSIANLVMTDSAILPKNRVGLLSCLSPALRASFCIVGSRLMLNLREVAKANQATHLSNSYQLTVGLSNPRSLATIDFRSSVSQGPAPKTGYCNNLSPPSTPDTFTSSTLHWLSINWLIHHKQVFL